MSGRRHLYLLIYLNTLIMKKHQYGSLFDYMNEGLGKWAGNIVNLMICLYFIGVASFEARAMAEMVKFFLLERTPVLNHAVYLYCLFRLFNYRRHERYRQALSFLFNDYDYYFAGGVFLQL